MTFHTYTEGFETGPDGGEITSLNSLFTGYGNPPPRFVMDPHTGIFGMKNSPDDYSGSLRFNQSCPVPGLTLLMIWTGYYEATGFFPSYAYFRDFVISIYGTEQAAVADLSALKPEWSVKSKVYGISTWTKAHFLKPTTGPDRGDIVSGWVIRLDIPRYIPGFNITAYTSLGLTQDFTEQIYPYSHRYDPAGVFVPEVFDGVYLPFDEWLLFEISFTPTGVHPDTVTFRISSASTTYLNVSRAIYTPDMDNMQGISQTSVYVIGESPVASIHPTYGWVIDDASIYADFCESSEEGLNVTRQFPRDDGRGFSSAPRLFPAPRGPGLGRVVGGFQ